LRTPLLLSKIRRLPAWQIIEKILLIAVLADLALGGNGYLIHIFGLRLREIFFVLCLAWVLLRLTFVYPIRLDRNCVWLFAVFLAITAFDAALGYYSGHQTGAILAELKPLSYFPMLLFFLVAIRTRQDLTLVAGMLVVCGMLVGLIYLLALLLTGMGIFNRMTLPWFLQGSGEFIFRRAPFVGFFYKGDFYICVAVIFLLFDPFRWSKALATVGIVAIGMTITRGLALGLIVSIAVGLLLNRIRRPWFLLGQCALLLIVLFLAEKTEIAWQTQPLAQTTSPAAPVAPVSPGDPVGPASPADPVRPASPAVETARPDGQNNPPEPVQDSVAAGTMQRWGDYQRLADFMFVWRELDPSMLLFGRGLGAPIAGRDRIESTYPEILYKQGLPGLFVWLAIATYLLQLYRDVPAQRKRFASAFLLSAVYVYVVTATNTFLTGSIGMAVVFISLASLLVLARERHPENMRPKEWYGF
jgi:hypothetical protein